MDRWAAGRARTWLIAGALACGVLCAGSGLAEGKPKGKSGEKQWQTLEGCRYQERDGNDGDSFGVQCGRRKFVLRLYFVDAPEKGASRDNDRVSEQMKYFGATFEDTLSAGHRANELAHNVLGGAFIVQTKMANAPGRSSDPRFYGLIQVGGRYLHEALLAEGLARVKGVPTTLPDGTKSSEYLKRLRALENQAHNERKGVWARSLK
jgi:endonuclease YncB( thermonuclease family)